MGNRRVPLGDPLLTPDEELMLMALMTPADIEAAKADKNRTALMALLLLALLGGSLYVWESERGAAGQYLNTSTGRYISSAIVRRELDRYLDGHDRTARTLAEQLRNGNISLAQWELEFRRHIRSIHLNAIALQRGGWAQMTMEDFSLAGRIVREQFEYLRRFAEQIANGSQPMDGTLAWRANLYSQAGRNTYYQSLHVNLPGTVTHVRSIRHARDSCRDCIELHGRWFAIGDPAYKLPGDRQCLHNCRCSESYGSFIDGAIVEAGTA